MTRCIRLLAILLILSAAPYALATPYELPDAELLDVGFKQIFGYSGATSTLDGKFDVAGPGVQFGITMAGSDNGKMAIGDQWPTSYNADFDWDPVLSHFTSLDAYDSYDLAISYVSGPAGDIDISLIMNTGLTGPSGFPTNDPSNNTFWAGSWMSLSPGETAIFSLDFAAAEAWGIPDNKAPHTGGGLGWPDGGIYAINNRDLNEVSNIGLQLADFDSDLLGAGQIVLHLNAVPEPATIVLLTLGCGAIAWRRRRR